MTEKPILFSGPMVRAILAGTKTQTRRVITREWSRCLDLDDAADNAAAATYSPYSADRLWVRETWRPVMEAYRSFVEFTDGDPGRVDAPSRDAMVFAKMALRFPGALKSRHSEAWHPSIHMPRWASRLTLAVESIRVERLQDITEEDARAEGVSEFGRVTDARGAFVALWESINGERPGCDWRSNPWVWRVAFSRVTP